MHEGLAHAWLLEGDYWVCLWKGCHAKRKADEDAP